MTTASVPIILLRTSKLKSNTLKLKVRVVENEFFKLGEVDKGNLTIERQIVFSDRYERPQNWSRVESSYYLGAYGRVKHKFMDDNTVERIDEDFIDRIMRDYAELMFFKNFFQSKLAEYNAAHPDNPLREEPEEGQTEGDLVTF